MLSMPCDGTKIYLDNTIENKTFVPCVEGAPVRHIDNICKHKIKKRGGLQEKMT